MTMSPGGPRLPMPADDKELDIRLKEVIRSMNLQVWPLTQLQVFCCFFTITIIAKRSVKIEKSPKTVQRHCFFF